MPIGHNGELSNLSQSATETRAPAQPPAPPAWFRGKRTAASGPSGAATARRLVVDASTAPPSLWSRWFKLSNVTGVGVSILLHAVALLILAFLWLPFESPFNPLLSNGDVETQVHRPFDKVPQLELPAAVLLDDDLQERGRARLFAPPKAIVAELPASLDVPKPDPSAQSRRNDADDDAGGGRVKGGPNPGKNAVEYGPFKVWPDPPAPAAKQPYFIWIRVKVPKSQKGRYSARDLSGWVKGNDSKFGGVDYRQTLPWDARLSTYGDPRFTKHTFRWDPKTKRRYHLSRRSRARHFRVQGDYAYLLVKVPGADVARVEDVVYVKSKLWKKDHTFRLVFTKQKRQKRRTR